MSPKLSTKHRLKIVKRVLSGEKKAKICREEGISRTILYKWLKRYRKDKHFCSLHPKGKAYKSFKKHPKLSTKDRHFMIDRVLEGESIARVCRLYDVSRTTFYRWQKRYSEAKSGQKFESLWDKKPKAEKYFNQSPSEYEKAVLSAVREYPEFSSHRIVYILPQIGGRPILGNHGVQNILRRHDLNTYEKRLIYSQSFRKTILISDFFALVKKAISQIGEQETPVRQFIVRAIFTIFFAIFTGTIFYGFSSLWRLIFGATGFVLTTGLIFSLLSLFLGMVFFIYSLKYYLTVAVVLSFSKESDGKDLRQAGKSLWERIFFMGGSRKSYQRKTFSANSNWQGGLNPDLSKIRLRRQPFVSIHVAVYNEKRVINRLLTAATEMDYPSASSGQANYEIIVVDDSKDETTEIAKQFLRDNYGELRESRDDKGNMVHKTPSSPNKPSITLIHRIDRSGFKGGALKEALKATNPKAEFILIFDADFIPYPDTITQFLKYFQSSCTSLDKRVLEKTNIAAVQGYQWHVLNKSENWITRGVRSEYAGSYVIERSGEEIYSGLKQISGSVYMIRKDVLQNIGWGTSITEDFQLTLKLYEQGYKVVYTPYIQAPAEAVSTIKRLIRQRMRWAEGHSHNVKSMFTRLLFGHFEEVNTTPKAANDKFLISPDDIFHTGFRTNEIRRNNYSNQIPNPNDQTISHSNIGNSLGQLEIRSIRNWKPSPLTLSEKLEFLYLAPYYLQSFLFMLGTFAWFTAEVIFRVQLPFWTEVWGWSLVFTNLIALPLMNMVGLFLEEADERDYFGLFSFIALSYIVAPFQGYAALKGFLAKEEGPWFRTPKTGIITDIFTPGKFYRKLFGLMQKPQAAFRPQISNIQFPISNFQSNPVLAFTSANNTFSSEGIRGIKGKRRGLKFAPKAIIAVFLTITIMLNYMTFFLPKAQAADVVIEQELNISAQREITTVSTTYIPTDNSIGHVLWDATKYSGTTVISFEASICNDDYFDGKDWFIRTTSIVLYDVTSDAEVSGSTLTGDAISTGCSWAYAATAGLSLTDDHVYSVRLKTSVGDGTARMRAARLVIKQSNATWITDTETQIEIGNEENSWNYASYTTLTDPKIYMYDHAKFTPAPTVNFEATLQSSNGTTTCNAQLYNNTDPAAVSGSEVTLTSTTTTRVRTGSSITLDTTNDDDYVVQVYRSAGSGTCRILNAKIVLTQSDTTNGVSALETFKMYNNSLFTTTSTVAWDTGSLYFDEYRKLNFAGGTFEKVYESIIKVTSGGTAYTGLWNQPAPGDLIDTSTTSQVSTTSTSYSRQRSGGLKDNTDWPTENTRYLDAVFKTTSGATVSSAGSWLIIQVSSLQVPENLLIFIPIVFFLPKIIKKIKRLRKREVLVAVLREH